MRVPLHEDFLPLTSLPVVVGSLLAMMLVLFGHPTTQTTMTQIPTVLGYLSVHKQVTVHYTINIYLHMPPISANPLSLLLPLLPISFGVFMLLMLFCVNS